MQDSSFEGDRFGESVTLQADGSFSGSVPAKGNYKVGLELSWYWRRGPGVSATMLQIALNDEKSVAIDEGAVVEIGVKEVLPRKIEGQVLLNGKKYSNGNLIWRGAIKTAYDSFGLMNDQLWSLDAEGRFSGVVISSAGYLCLPSHLDRAKCRLNADFRQSSIGGYRRVDNIEVTESGTVIDLDFKVEPLDLTLTRKDGLPIPRDHELRLGRQGFEARAAIDANGLARFEQIEPGIYELQIGPASSLFGASHLLTRRFEVKGPVASFVIEEFPPK